MISMNRKLIKITRNIIISGFLVLLATIISFGFNEINFPVINSILIYLLSVLLTALLTNGYLYGIITSIICTFTFNYFFTEPYHTFSVNDASYLITFVVMTITSLIVSTLISKVKKNTLQAQEKEHETKLLFSLNTQLTQAKNIKNIAKISIDTIENMLKCDIGFWWFNENNTPNDYYIQKYNDNYINKNIDNIKQFEYNILNVDGDYIQTKNFNDYRIYGNNRVLGCIRVPNNVILENNKSRLLHSMIESIALAMDRLYSENKTIQLHEQATQERYKSNLLRSISHDLRTPLSAIMGSSEIIMDMTDKENAIYSMADSIYKDANWLYSLVENILSLTRIQDGRLNLTKQTEAIEEVIGSTLDRISKHYPNLEISVEVPKDCLLIPMDAKLIQQVLLNLIDNAIKHTGNNKEISIITKKDSITNQAIIKVIDNGEGIAEKDLPNIFKTFYTTDLKPSDAKKGIGLGLAICEAIILAHNGNISAKNRTDTHGAEFTFTLPLN